MANLAEEIPNGPNLACENLTVRGALTVAGGTVGALTVGANLQGTGAPASPLAVVDAFDQSAAGKTSKVGNNLVAVISPAIGADQNDWNPAGLSGAAVINVNATGVARLVSGLVGGVTGRVITIRNSGTLYIYLLGASGLSTLGNRFKMADGDKGGGSTIQLFANDAATFMYDGTQWVQLRSSYFGDAYVNGTFTCGNTSVLGTLTANNGASFGGRATVSDFRATLQTPAVIAADQNDYNPSGLTTATMLLLQPDAARAITGMQGGFAGRIMELYNSSAFVLTLNHEDVLSAAANRFICPGAVPHAIAAGRSVRMFYSAGSRWVLLLT